jgi:hypothetical protein
LAGTDIKGNPYNAVQTGEARLLAVLKAVIIFIAESNSTANKDKMEDILP